MVEAKERKNSSTKFPCGNLEEMLRIMRICRKKGNIDCEAMMKKFNMEEIMKNCWK